MMTNAEHLIETAVTALELHDPYDAYSIFMYNPRNAEMAALAGVSLDAVWEMAQYCLMRMECKDDSRSCETIRWIPVTERLPDIAGMSVLVVAVNSYGQKEVVQAFTNYSCPVEFETNVKDYEMIWKTAWKVTHWMPLPDAPEEGQDE